MDVAMACVVVSPADKPSAADKLSSVARVTQVPMVVAEVHSKVRMVGKYCGLFVVAHWRWACQ